MARPNRHNLVVARSSFFHGRLFVAAGEVWVGDDPLVIASPSAFGPLTVRSSGPAPIAERVPVERLPVEPEPEDPS
jgi:hypothetical protein